MHYYTTKRWKKCGQCVYAKIMCPCPCLPSPLNNKEFLLLLGMTGNTKSPSLATFMKLVKWMGIKMHIILLLTRSGKYGLFQNDCFNFGVLGLLKKKKNWYILSLWKVFFFLTVGRSTRCTIFSSTYISLQKVQYSAVCTYNLNTNTTSNLCFRIILTPTLRKIHMKCLYYKETAMMLIFKYIMHTKLCDWSPLFETQSRAVWFSALPSSSLSTSKITTDRLGGVNPG